MSIIILPKLLLMQKEYTNNNGSNRIELLSKKTTELQPQIAKYYYELAAYLQKINKLVEANESYQIALILVNNNDKEMLKQYCVFFNEMKDVAQEGIKSMELSSDIKQDDEMQTNDIQLVVYEFESIITYWNLNKSMNGYPQITQHKNH